MKTHLIKRLLMPATMIALAGCMTPPERKVETMNRINQEMQQAADTPAPKDSVPASVSGALLPPLKIAAPKASAKQLEQRFDLVVSDSPVAQVFMGIVSGTRYSMMINPDVQGAVSVNLKDVTVFEALDAIREMYGYEYKVEGSRIFVNKPQLQTRVFKVNYVVGLRRGRSDLSVTSGAAGDSGGTSSMTQSQASSLTSSQKGDFWSEVEDAIRVTLNCKIPQMTLTNTSSSGQNSTSEDNRAMSTLAETNYGARDRGLDGCPEGRSVLVNQMSNTVLVRAMPDELRSVNDMLRTMQVNVEKQVILEAKIIDVVLNEGSQQGINWSAFNKGNHRMSVGANTTRIYQGNQSYSSASTSTAGNDFRNFPSGGVLEGSTLGQLLGTGLAGATGGIFGAGLGIALTFHDFSALIDFLETQGEVQVLSSPRISTTNNQKAVLKVGTDEQYVTGFDNNSNTTNTTGGTTVNQPTPVYSTFFSGISLDVTPQIDDVGNVTLHVHPLVSQVEEVEKITIGNQKLPFASNRIKETDSVVKVADGQVVVIGGLMTEENWDQRGKVPGAGDMKVGGAMFRKGKQGSYKRELVILLKPTVVKGNEEWQQDISATQQRIEKFGR